jgi:hypothetical protein
MYQIPEYLAILYLLSLSFFSVAMKIRYICIVSTIKVMKLQVNQKLGGANKLCWIYCEYRVKFKVHFRNK